MADGVATPADFDTSKKYQQDVSILLHNLEEARSFHSFDRRYFLILMTAIEHVKGRVLR